MNLKKVNDKLNKDINEETALINSLTIGKYLLIYVPLLFVMFATAQFVATLFLDFQFSWIAIFVQAVCFALFFRVFHYLRKHWNDGWKNK